MARGAQFLFVEYNDGLIDDFVNRNWRMRNDGRIPDGGEYSGLPVVDPNDFFIVTETTLNDC